MVVWPDTASHCIYYNIIHNSDYNNIIILLCSLSHSLSHTHTQNSSGPAIKELTWNKSIEICKLGGGEVIQVAEHPLTLDDSKATVTYITEKLSNEAFDGAKVRLLNAKNILLADVEGTRGKNLLGPNLST